MGRGVGVLPWVRVMTIDPGVRSGASLVRICGSIALATSRGRVVPPPRLVARLSAPVALPARTAAVLRAALLRVRRGGGGGGALGPRWALWGLFPSPGAVPGRRRGRAPDMTNRAPAPPLPLHP